MASSMLWVDLASKTEHGEVTVVNGTGWAHREEGESRRIYGGQLGKWYPRSPPALALRNLKCSTLKAFESGE